MGTFHHHAIVVTSWDRTALEKCHKMATKLMAHVSNIVDGVTNGYSSFAVFPDGSKEGWDYSNDADVSRKTLIMWIDTMAYEDGSNKIQYAEVSFGELAPTIKTNAGDIK